MNRITGHAVEEVQDNVVVEPEEEQEPEPAVILEEADKAEEVTPKPVNDEPAVTEKKEEKKLFTFPEFFKPKSKTKITDKEVIAYLKDNNQEELIYEEDFAEAITEKVRQKLDILKQVEESQK